MQDMATASSSSEEQKREKQAEEQEEEIVVVQEEEDDAEGTDSTEGGWSLPAPQFPFVLLCDPDKDNHLLNLPESRVHLMKENWEGRCIGSVGSWLIISRISFKGELLYNRIYFLNPVSGVLVNLPPEKFLIPPERRMGTRTCTKVVTSSAPDSSECLVVGYFSVGNTQWISFCRPKDIRWCQIASVHSPYHIHLALLEKTLYRVTFNEASDSVFVYDLSFANYANSLQKLVILDPKPESGRGFQVIKNGREYHTVAENVFLVKDSSCGEILLVFQLKDDTEALTFRVFKLDASGPRWKEVDNLGDRSIFLSYMGSEVISADKLNGPEEFKGGNRIFFAFQSKKNMDAGSRRDVGVFSLTDRSIRQFPVLLIHQSPISTLWFTPSHP